MSTIKTITSSFTAKQLQQLLSHLTDEQLEQPIHIHISNHAINGHEQIFGITDYTQNDMLHKNGNISHNV